MRFSFFGIPVEVRPAFLLLLGVIGLYFSRGPDLVSVQAQIFAGAAVATALGIFAHEMGHAFEAKRAGASPTVTLVFYGGVTRFTPRASAWRNLWITAAGVLYQLALAGLAYWAYRWGPFPSDQELWRVVDNPALLFASVVLRVFVLLNVFWALLNLVPIGGLDGGAIIQYALQGFGVKRTGPVMIVIYSIMGALAGVWALSNQDWLLLAIIAYFTVTGIRAQTQMTRFETDRASYGDAETTVRRLAATGRYDELLVAVRAMRSTATSKPFAVFAVSVEVLALIRLGKTEELRELVQKSGGMLDGLPLSEALEAADLHAENVDHFLPTVREHESVPPIAASVCKSLIRLGRAGEAARIAGNDYLADLPFDSLVEIHRDLIAFGETSLAAGLRESMAAKKGVDEGIRIRLAVDAGLLDDVLARLSNDHNQDGTTSALAWLAVAVAQTGNLPEAGRALDAAVDRGLPVDTAKRIQDTLSAFGQHALSSRMGGYLLGQTTGSRERSVISYDMACSLAALGEFDRSLEYLAQVEPDSFVEQAVYDKRLDPIRREPGFAIIFDTAAEASAGATR